MKKKVVLITGASSGIGKETALKLIDLGYTVYGAARRQNELKSLEKRGGHAVYLDITNDESIQECVNTVLTKEGKIDILINNAGYGFYSPIETTPIEEARKQFEVNYFGLARITQLVLPSMRKRKSGRIINIASMGAKFTIPFGAWYHGTKYAVESFSDSLRMEMKPYNIKVVVIEPGMIQTNWGNIAATHLKNATAGTPYAKNGAIEANYFESYYKGNSLTSPDTLSKAVVKAATAKNPKTRYLTGKYAKIFPALRFLLCDHTFDFFVYKVMGLKSRL